MLLKGFRDEKAKSEEQVQDFGRIMGVPEKVRPACE